MEPQRRELLAQCQQSLAQAMTEVEAVLGLLEAAGALSPGERRQLDEEAGGAKAELLLKLLLAKERDHFQDLRAALEKTQPHLLPILYLNGVVGPPQPSEGAGEWQTPGPASGTAFHHLSLQLPGGNSRGLWRWVGASVPWPVWGGGPCVVPYFAPPPPIPPVAVNNARHCRPGLSGCQGIGVLLRPPGPADLGGMSGSPFPKALHHPSFIWESLLAFNQ